jgi:hypothetical protein
MATPFRFTFEKNWAQAPIAFWVHAHAWGSKLPGAPIPQPVSHRGYAMLHVDFGGHELSFSAPAQLDHCIEVLSLRPLPTSRWLAARPGLPVGPNGHWLSRLPATLKSPRRRARLVAALREVREKAVAPGSVPTFIFS